MNEFYTNLFDKIVISSKQIYNIGAEYEDAAALLLSKLADSIASFNRANFSSVSDKKTSNRLTLCERVKCGLQFIGGYVMRKLKKESNSFE